MKRFLYKQIGKYLSFFIYESAEVLEISNQGSSLLKKHIKSRSYRVNPGAAPMPDPRPDFVILNGVIHYEKDIQTYLLNLRNALKDDSRLIITYYNSFWKPFLKLATLLGLRNKMPEENWISHEDVINLLSITDYEIIHRESKVLFPFWFPVLSWLFNHVFVLIPVFRWFALANIAVARKVGNVSKPLKSVSIVVPARNEAGNIEEITRTLPKFTDDDELIFIEGNSIDNTWETIEAVRASYSGQRRILTGQQDGKGKGDAVRKGFDMATGDILMIYDADMTVPAEDLIKFYNAIVSNKGEFINGSRLVYPMEKKAMRFFNIIGNKFFALSFSAILGQRFKDTLCGTKVISRNNYRKLIINRKYFGNFDPFGDFDLIFGAAKLALKIIEIPVRYRERTYGDTNIQRWKHGWILLRMLIFAIRKIRFI